MRGTDRERGRAKRSPTLPVWRSPAWRSSGMASPPFPRLSRLPSAKADDDTGYKYGARDARPLPYYLLDPDSPRMVMWDCLTGATLLFVAAFTPFEVAFLRAPTTATAPLFIVGRVVDSIFIVDIMLCFFIARPSKADPSRLETRWSVGARNYLCGWFVLDAISLVSSAFDIIPLFTGGGGGGKKSPLTGFRVIRILRLVKLVRLVRASSRLRALSVSVALPRSVLTVCTALFEVTYLIHLIACILGLVTIIPASPLDTWLATHGYCKPTAELVEGTTDEYVAECSEAGYLYLQTVWWSGGMILGAPISHSPDKGPYEEYYSRPDDAVKFTVGEQVTILALKTFAAFFFLTVTARFVTVYNNLDPDQKQFNQGWDALNRFVQYFKVSKVDARELRRFYVEQAEEARARSRVRTMHNFTPFLAEKFVWKINKDWLLKVRAQIRCNPCAAHHAHGLCVRATRCRASSSSSSGSCCVRPRGWSAISSRSRWRCSRRSTCPLRSRRRRGCTSSPTARPTTRA